MSKFVYTIERYKTLHQKAKELLKIIKAKNIFFRHSDGGLGWVEQAPFDRGIKDFYMTDPISRASKVMAECSEVFGNAKNA